MKYLLVLISVVTQSALACSDFNWEWTAEKWEKNPEAIYHGMVASVSLSEKSIYDGESDPLYNAFSLRGELHIKFKVFETLKGKRESVVSTILPECIGGVTDFGDTALLFRVGNV